MCVCCLGVVCRVLFFKQNTAYEMRISDWSSDVCSSDLGAADFPDGKHFLAVPKSIGHVGQDLGNFHFSKPVIGHHGLVIYLTVNGYRIGHAVANEAGELVTMLPEIQGIGKGRDEFFKACALDLVTILTLAAEIGRASCRERVCQYV